MTTDCQIIEEWIPELLEAENCCEDSHITCRTSRIISLNLSSVEIDSKLPDSFKTLSELEILDLSNSVSFGYLSEYKVLLNLNNLQILNLGSNSLLGPIFADIGSLTKLRVLKLENNWLEGLLPVSLKHLILLEELYLANNAVSGIVPYLPLLRIIAVDQEVTIEASPQPSQTNAAIPAEGLLSGEETRNSIVPLVIIFVLLVFFAMLSTFGYIYRNKIRNTYRKRLERRRNRSYIAGSSFTASEALDGYLIADHVSETPASLPITIITEGNVFGTGEDTIKIETMVGNGGFGDVWRAKYRGIDVAVKTMRESTDPADLRRNLKLGNMLTREAEIMEHMKHERIVLFIGFRITPLSLVMEYLPLGTLKELIAEGTDIRSWELRYQMMLDICEGMEFLHATINPVDGKEKMRCFHQDLKTGNVLLEMLDGSLRAKITDFGLSCKHSFHS
jgi:hypothetical protein